MTAPAIAAPAPAVSAPITQAGTFGIDDALASITSEAVAATLKESPEPTGEEPARDEKGRFQAKPADGSEAPDPATPLPGDAVGDGAGEDELEPVVLPEGMAAVKKIEGRELAAAFKVLDGEGELEVPDISLEFEANGKTRREPIDKVVKLAQMGVYNHEREQRITQETQRIQSREHEFEQMATRAREMQQERERLLSDPDYLVAQLTRYEQENTPEARLTREREQVEQQRQEFQFQQMHAQGTQFFTGEIIPAIETITKALPFVSEEEIGAKLLLLSERFKVQTPQGSVVPPSAYAQVKAAFVAEVVPWAQQLHEHRDTERKTAAASSRKEVDKANTDKLAAQVASQKAKNLIGRTVKPGTRSNAGTSTKETAPPKPIRTLEDAEAETLRLTLASVT